MKKFIKFIGIVSIIFVFIILFIISYFKITAPEGSAILQHYCFGNGEDLELKSDYLPNSPVIINKLKKMARDNLEPNNFNNLRIIVPDNKTSSEELYGSPELQMLAPAPANTPVTEDKPADDKKDVSGGSTNNSNIKKIIF